MKDNINWELDRGYIPEKLNYDRNIYYRKQVIKRLPRGFDTIVVDTATNDESFVATRGMTKIQPTQKVQQPTQHHTLSMI